MNLDNLRKNVEVWRWNDTHCYEGRTGRIWGPEVPEYRVIKPARIRVGDLVVLHPNTKLLERAAYPHPIKVDDVGVVERVAFTRESVSGWDSFHIRFFSLPECPITLWEVELKKVSDKPTEH